MKIILTHIGGSPPPYIAHCLRQYRLFNPKAETVFIGGKEHLKSCEALFRELRIEPVASESLENDSSIQKFGKVSYFKKSNPPRTNYPTASYFWHYAIERFFFIAAYMKKSRSENVFHFENDVMIYRDLADVLDCIVRRPRQMYITPVGDQWVACGLLFVDNHESLDRFCDFVIKELPKGDERIRKEKNIEMVSDMTLLKVFGDEQKSLHYFPILPEGSHAYEFDRFSSVFDPASWGQYAGGTNNGHAAGWAGEHHYIGKEILAGKYRLAWKREKSLKVPFVVDSKDHQTRLNNLHIHSKKLVEFLSVDSPYLAKEPKFSDQAAFTSAAGSSFDYFLKNIDFSDSGLSWKGPISRGVSPMGDHQLERDRPKPYILKALEIFRARQGKVIVEIGTSGGGMFHRLDEDGGSWGEHCCNSGHSTLLFAMSGAAEVWSVDINPDATEGAKRFLSSSEHTRNFKGLHCVTQDGIDFLKKFPKPIDLLYLDAWDVAPGFYAEKHLQAYLQAKDKLHEKSLILIDDTDVDEGGKGKWVVPKAVEDGYKVIFSGRQTLLVRK